MKSSEYTRIKNGYFYKEGNTNYVSQRCYYDLLYDKKDKEDEFYIICDGVRVCEICDRVFPFCDNYNFHICKTCKDRIYSTIYKENEGK